jgi:hypothetical protein
MLNWVTTSSLGSIETGSISELSVSATQSLSQSEITYKLTSGNLPNGLQLRHDGTIEGQAIYDSTGTFTFSIEAFDATNVELISKEFQLQVIQNSSKKFTSIYVKPLLSVQKRKEYSQFIKNNKIFDPNLIYRSYDKNFGIQSKIKLILDFGIEQLNLVEYLYPLYENFYKKRIRLGSIKTAIAKNSQGTHIYDVIYANVIDELAGASRIFYTDFNDEIYYPGSIDNMKLQLQEITLQNYSQITVNEKLQPRFMLTNQENDFRLKTYFAAVPICYTLPGKSQIIVNNINKSNFKFNVIDFEIDRIYVTKSLDYQADKYLIFDRQSLGDLVDTDQYLLGPEGWIRLDDENDQPLLRE